MAVSGAAVRGLRLPRPADRARSQGGARCVRGAHTAHGMPGPAVAFRRARRRQVVRFTVCGAAGHRLAVRLLLTEDRQKPVSSSTWRRCDDAITFHVMTTLRAGVISSLRGRRWGYTHDLGDGRLLLQSHDGTRLCVTDSRLEPIWNARSHRHKGATRSRPICPGSPSLSQKK
jgi:hypothetical protein